MPVHPRTDLIAIASFGGHLEELLELRTAWSGLDCLYVTTRPVDAEFTERNDGVRIEVVPDCHQGQVTRILACSRQVYRLLRTHRPSCIVTTGALPGLIMAVMGRLAGARVIWIDSLANSDTLSGSGRYARWIADRHLTQWPGVAKRDGTHYSGSLF